MIKFKKISAIIVAAVLIFTLFTGSGNAVFNKTELTGGLFQLNVVHNVVMDSLEDEDYTVWTSAMCTAVGKDGDGKIYLITDASLTKPDRFYSSLGNELLTLLKDGGINISSSELPNYAVVTSTLYYIVHDGANIPLTIVPQNISDKLLVLTLSDPSYDLGASAFTFSYADLLKANDTVYTFALSGAEIDGMISAKQDAYVTNWSLSTLEGKVTFPAEISDGYNALTYSDIPASRAGQGSALFDSNGYLVGLNIWSNAYDGTVSITSNTITSILGHLKIQYSLNENESGNFSIKDILLYLIILAAAVILLVVLLLIIRNRKKKLDLDDVSDLEIEARSAREEESVRGQRTERISGSQQKNSSGSQRITDKQNRATTFSVNIPPVASAPAMPVKTPQSAALTPQNVTLTVLSGKLRGTTVDIMEKITIGRDPTLNNIVFPADTTEVSRRHCAITFNKQTGRVLLEDLSSANGTYFPSGSRIIPGRLYSLRNNDKFYLGLPDNMMQVSIQYLQKND